MAKNKKNEAGSLVLETSKEIMNPGSYKHDL